MSGNGTLDWHDAIMPDEVLEDLVTEQVKANAAYSLGKPGKGVIFRVHPDLHANMAFWNHDLDTDSTEQYVVMSQEVATQHKTRVTVYHVYLYGTHDGRFGVWLVNNLANNKYGRTGHVAAKLAMSEWIQIHSDNSRKRYNINKVPSHALEGLNDPKWPELEHIAEAVTIAIDDDLVIGSLDHPIVRAIGTEVVIDLSTIK